MPSHSLVRKDLLILIAVASTLVIANPSISNNGYFDITKIVYGQSGPDQMNSNTTNSVNIQDIPAKKVHVGDIDIAYKTFGKGDPILLISGYSFAMDSWDSTLLETLASNHSVIVFDNRGIGNTTSGSEQKFSIPLFANDTAGFLEALNIKKADVLAWSMGGRIAQELTLNYPDRVGKLILYAIGCGGEGFCTTKSGSS